MTFSLNYLQCFLEVASTQSISEAARRLDLTQPSLSRQVRRLEEQVGTSLFVRTRSGVQLTAEGQRFHARIAPLVGEIGLAIGATRDEAGVVSGPIRCGAIAEAGHALLFPAILAFQRQYPAVDVHLEYLKEVEIIEKLRSGALDFALITSPLEGSGFRSATLVAEKGVVVTRASNRLDLNTVADLEAACLIGYRQGDPLLAAFVRRHFPSLSLARLRMSISVNSHRSMLLALCELDAYAVMPAWGVDSALRDKTLRIASRKTLEGRLYLVWVEGTAQKVRDRLFRESILRYAKLNPAGSENIG